MYTVPENNRTVPLCIDIGVELTEETPFTITSKSKDPTDAQGRVALKKTECLFYSFLISCTEADFFPSTTVTVTPPSSVACIDFTNIVVDDNIALEGDQSFNICVGDSTSMVVIIDDDGECIL